MRRLVAALVMAALALSLTACGGGNADSAAAEEPPAAAPAPAAPAPAAVPVSATNRLSPSEPGTGQPFPTSTSSVPKVVLDKLADNEPMIVFFYDPEQKTTRDQRLEIEAAMREYRGLIELIELDVTAALPDPLKKQAPAEAEQTALLVQELQVGFTPYTILVDKRGMMTGRFRGYIDRALLDREILKATQ